MSDAFWSQLFSNAPAIIGALFAGIAMIVSLFNGRKIKDVKQDVEAGAVQRAEQTKKIEAVQETADRTQRVAFDLKDGHRELAAQVAKTNTFTAGEIDKLIADHVSRNSAPAPLSKE